MSGQGGGVGVLEKKKLGVLEKNKSWSTGEDEKCECRNCFISYILPELSVGGLRR